MAWNSFATPLIGKAVRAASRLAHGGGSAFPGKIVERIDPQFLSRTLAQLPLGVVLVSGTNGKTTTTRMVASMLQSLGLKVFTNPTGSNFTRGVGLVARQQAWFRRCLRKSRFPANSTPTSRCWNSTRRTPCISSSRCRPTTACCST